MVLKELPSNIDAEKMVIGSIFIDNEAFIKISDFLYPDDFYVEKHKLIFESIIELFNKHENIDMLTVSNNLKSKKLLDIIGGKNYIAEITQNVITSSHVFEYANIIKNKSTLRKIIKSGMKITGLGYEEDKDINEILEESEKALFNITQSTIKNRFVHIKDILNLRYEEFAKLHDSDNKDVFQGIPTGFKYFDERTGGLKTGEFIVLAARPSMGKTSLVLNMAENISIKSKKTVGIVSLEMTKEQLVDRMFTSLLGVDSWKLHKGELEDNDFSRLGEIMDDLSQAKIFIDDAGSVTVNEIKSKARRLQMEHGIDILIIDYLQLMTGSTTNMNNRVQEISEISRSLKALARELSIPIIALSQLSRAVENRPSKIPQLSDLRESGAIEQDADIVIMMYRDDYYDEDSDRKGITDIYIRKNRNGPTGKIELFFKKEQMKFKDIEYNRNNNDF